MVDLRADIAKTALGKAEKAFPYSAEYLDYEQFKTIGKEAFTNIGLGFGMVSLVILVMLGNIRAAAATLACVAAVIVELVGFMHFWGTTLDSVVVIFLVISMGLAVDYSAHVAHGFLLTSGSRDKRLETALVEAGAAVVNGGISTLIAVLLLSSSSTYVFYTFFRSLFLTVIFGLAHGLLVVPVFLWLLDPAPHAGHEREESDLEMKKLAYESPT